MEILQRLCLHDRLSVQHRGLVIAYNLLAADAELAKKLVESELLEILTVVGKQEPDEKRAAVVQTARECLIKCMDYGFIKSPLFVFTIILFQNNTGLLLLHRCGKEEGRVNLFHCMSSGSQVILFFL